MAYKRIVVGVDVAKRTLACCILIRTESETSKVYLEVSNSIEGFNQLHTQLKKHRIIRNRIRIVMEPTGIYHCACRDVVQKKLTLFLQGFCKTAEAVGGRL